MDAEDKKKAQIQRERKQANTYNQFLVSKQRKHKHKKSQALPCYGPDEERQKQLTKAVAIFVGGTSIANSIVDNDLFTSMLNVSDPRYMTCSCPCLLSLYKV